MLCCEVLLIMYTRCYLYTRVTEMYDTVWLLDWLWFL